MHVSLAHMPEQEGEHDDVFTFDVTPRNFIYSFTCTYFIVAVCTEQITIGRVDEVNKDREMRQRQEELL